MTRDLLGLARHVSTPLLLVRRSGEIVELNDAAARALGRRGTAALTGARLQELCARGGERLGEHLELCARTTSSVPGALLVAVDGTETRFRSTGRAVTASSGRERLVLLELRKQDEHDAFILLSQQLAELTEEIRGRKRTEEALHAEARRLTALRAIGGALANTTTVEMVADALVARLHDVIVCAAVSLIVPGGEDGALVVERTALLGGAGGAAVPGRRAALEVARRAIDRGEPLWLEPYEPGLPVASALPLVSEHRCVGACVVGFAAPPALTPSDRDALLSVARQAAQAVERARLYEAEQASRAAAERSAESARRAEQRKDEFLAMLSHELRNPLAPIATALQLMRLRGSDDLFARERTVIERQLQHVVGLVDDLMDVSRITRGKLELHREVVELAPIATRAIEMASPIFEKHAQHLEVDVAREALLVDVDPVRMAQVLANLLTNAGKYTPPGGHIRLSARRAGGEIVIRVTDDGVGIPPELLPVVFEMFVQGKRPIERVEGGLGLGLAIVRSLVTMHDGTVDAHSDGEPGRGTEVVIRLPAATALRAARSPTPARGQPRLGGAARRVLIVDDNEDAAQLIAEALSAVGHVTHVCFDGPSALEVVRDFAPDTAVLDIGLPLMDGYDLARRIRGIPSLERVRLIAVTGYGQDSDRQRSAEVGFHSHLVKPVHLEQLLGLLG